MGSGVAPRDDNGAPVLALWNDATGQAVPLHAAGIVTGADGKKYALLDTGFGGVSPGLDNTNELRVSAYGKNVAAGDTPLLVDASGRAIIGNVVQIGGQAVKLDNTNEQAVSIYGKSTNPGDTPLLVDASGRPLINVAQIGGQAPTLDNTSVLAVSTRGKGTVAGDTPFLVETRGLLAGADISEDTLRALIHGGQGFVATSGVLATATNANVFIAMGLLASNIAKNVFIYRILAGPQNTSGDYHLATMTAFDANVATAVTPANLSLGSATTPLATVKSTANGNTAPTSSTGTNIIQYGSAANLGAMEFLQNGAGIFIPAGQTQGVTAWIKIPTAANSGQITMFWVEF